MIESKKEEFDLALQSLITKIDGGIVTCEDFNKLISTTMIIETTPEAVRDRLRRRTIKNDTDSHIDNETGHQPLEPPTFAARVQPKRKPVNQQNHGRAKLAHAHSAKTQSKTMAASFEDAAIPLKFQDAMAFIIENVGKPLSDELLATINDKPTLHAMANKLMSKPKVNRDWLHDLIIKLG